MEKSARKTWEESKTMWAIAAPAIATVFCQFSIGLVTSAFVGHLGAAELAAVSIVQNVIECFAFGVLLGMGSALETLCGQAVGAGQLSMLGIYMQRSWVITGTAALFITPIYIFTSPILKLLRQPEDISDLAGFYCRWVIPQLFAYAMNFPLQKFFQSQSKVWVMALISGAALGVHTLLTWVFVSALGHGLVGAAIAGNVSWWLINFAQIGYLLLGHFAEAWKGFSLSAFRSLSAFVKLSVASAIMLWFSSSSVTLQSLSSFLSLKRRTHQPGAMVLLGGDHNGGLPEESAASNRRNLHMVSLNTPEMSPDDHYRFSLSLSLNNSINYQVWGLMIAFGFNAAVSVRVSNELGAGRPKAAKFSVLVTVSTSGAIGLIFTAIVLVSRVHLPRLFTEIPEVERETAKLAYLLAPTILLNSIQPVLSGVAIGAGWQSSVAFINSACYYLFGLPIGGILGFKFDLKALGIWSGMLVGCLLQTIVLVLITATTDWYKEAAEAEDRIRVWGGSVELPSSSPQPQD